MSAYPFFFNTDFINIARLLQRMRAISYEKKWKSYSADLICYPLISANKITLKLWSIESPVAARLKRPLRIGRTSRVKQKWSKLRDFMMNDAGFTWSKRKSNSEKKTKKYSLWFQTSIMILFTKLMVVVTKWNHFGLVWPAIWARKIIRISWFSFLMSPLVMHVKPFSRYQI